jgi:hypothetical protein
MSLSNNALTTLENIKEYLNITGTDDDLLLENLIDRATGIIEIICNRPLKNVDGQDALVAQTEYFNGGGRSKLFLKYYPISSITSIHDDPDRVYGADTLIDSDEYAFWADEGIVEFDGAGTVGSGVKNIKVIYKGGYTAATLPYDIEQICIELVAILYKMRDRIGVSSKSFSDGSASYFENLLTPQSREVLRKYSKLDH